MCYLYTLDLSEDMNLEKDYLFFLSIITHSFCLSTARDKWSICACFLWVGTESHKRYSQGARVIKCDSTICIIRASLPALAGKAICCFPRQVELRVMLFLRESPTPNSQYCAFSRNFCYFSIIYFI